MFSTNRLLLTLLRVNNVEWWVQCSHEFHSRKCFRLQRSLNKNWRKGWTSMWHFVPFQHKLSPRTVNKILKTILIHWNAQFKKRMLLFSRTTLLLAWQHIATATQWVQGNCPPIDMPKVDMQYMHSQGYPNLSTEGGECKFTWV